MAHDDAHDDLLDEIARLRGESAAQLGALGGSSSACSMGRDGRSYPAYKYQEGLAAGYGSVLRALRRAPADALASVETLAASSGEELDRRAGSGRDWEAYAHGVLDAVLAVRDLIGPGR